VRLPAGFVIGAATSAYQIEGGIDEDGRSPSIWDRFCAVPGAIADGSSGAVAADHRHRWREDVGIMAGLGLDAYRFSVAWPRIVPDGGDAVSEDGLDFYRALVDALLEDGIEPYVTLYHWDLPQALQDRGGWPERDTAARFADYAAVVGAALGDRVRHWSTINEPWCAAMLGHASGVHAPGVRDPRAAVRAAHHLLVAHGAAVGALRPLVRPDAEITITLNPYPVVPAGDSDDDADAVRRVDGIANRIWTETVLRGRYPDDVLVDLAAVCDLDHVRDGDLDVISAPIDGIGVNYYRRHHVRHRSGASAAGDAAMWPGSPDVELVQPPGPATDGGWAIEPDGLAEVLLRLHEDYRVPLTVHEAGAAFDEPIGDRARIDWLAAHLRAALGAIDVGVDLRGFFVWSLIDNFEWAEGYERRFGVVHVDFDSLRRTEKDSARWLRHVIATRSV
jgi:beta-glucosidase